MQALNSSAAAAPNAAAIVPFNTKSPSRHVLTALCTLRDPDFRLAVTTQLLLAPSSLMSLAAASKEKKSKKKAVNSFVGFRCEYWLDCMFSQARLTCYVGHYTQIPALKGLPMMAMSGVLGDLWRQDLNQSLWALIAQAWTAIRDQVGDVKARRDEFFQVLFDHLPIPSPATYLEDHGLSVKMNEAGVLTLEHLPNPPMVQSLVSAGLISPTLSSEELIVLAQGQGFALDYKPGMNASSATFLGRSVQQRNDQRQVPAYATFPDPRIRVTKNKKRRFELQTRTTESNFCLLQHSPQYFKLPVELTALNKMNSQLSQQDHPLAAMRSRIYPHVTNPSGAALVAGHEVSVDFSTALDTCTREYNCGRYTVVFPDTLYLRYGHILFEYFRKTLSERIGASVSLSSVVDSNGSRSLIQMGQLDVPQHRLDVQPVIDSHTATSDLSAGAADAVVAGKKKVPRPMNSWLFFREEQHKILKANYPNISVQEICKYN
jgi:hypothetical protein